MIVNNYNCFVIVGVYDVFFLKDELVKEEIFLEGELVGEFLCGNIEVIFFYEDVG